MADTKIKAEWQNSPQGVVPTRQYSTNISIAVKLFSTSIFIDC